MPTRKIADLPKACTDPEHGPPAHAVLSPGVYEHECPACGHKIRFTVAPPGLLSRKRTAGGESDMLVYRMKSTRSSSDRLGPCEVCDKHCSEVHIQTPLKWGADPEPFLYHAGPSRFGHKGCLLSIRTPDPEKTT